MYVSNEQTFYSLLSERYCRDSSALFLISQDGTLQLFFAKKDVPACMEREIFDGDKFEITESYTLPTEFADRIYPGMDPEIPAGLYPIIRLENGYVVPIKRVRR
jgi:hypothetical protein